MNPTALSALLAWIKTQGVELLRGSAAAPQSTGFKLGEQYLGKVLENLGGGRALVQIGDQVLDMRMPAQARGPQPGDTLRLTYLTSSARPTFVLDPDTGGATARAAVQVSVGAQQINALAGYVRELAAQPPGPTAAGASSSAPSSPSPSIAGATTTDTGSPATGARLSSAATQASALSRAVAAEVPGMGGRAVSAAQVVQAASTAAAAAQTVQAATPAGASLLSLAQLAQQAARLSPQDRPLLTNPSALLAASATTAAGTSALNLGGMPTGSALDAARAAVATASSLNAQGMMLASGPGVLMLAQRLRQGLAESGLFYESHLGRWVQGGLSLEAVRREPQSRLSDPTARLLSQPGLDGMPEEAARMAGRQLLMLEGGPAAWHGTVWPGQEMSWLVEEGEGGSEGDEDGPRWRTRLRLVLPVLGEVEAAIEISACGLDIDLAATRTETRGRLLAALPTLVAQLQVAELPPTRLRVLDSSGATEDAHVGP